jgi:hypothetical protein
LIFQSITNRVDVPLVASNLSKTTSLLLVVFDKTNADTFHISISSSKRVVRQFIDTVIQRPPPAIKLPTHDKLEELAVETTKKSTCDGSFHGCVLMIDGFLSTRNKPSVNNCRNLADYYNSHKKTFGLAFLGSNSHGHGRRLTNVILHADACVIFVVVVVACSMMMIVYLTFVKFFLQLLLMIFFRFVSG